MKKLLDIIEQEVQASDQNQQVDNEDFEFYMDLFDAVRSEKNVDAEGMPDIFIPEFPTHMITQASMDNDQYFQTKEFVETYVMDPSDEAKKAAAAAKELINRTLNRRDLYHFAKFTRAKMLSTISSVVYAKCWWELDIQKIQTGYEEDEFGEVTVDIDNKPIPVFENKIITDQFNYCVFDRRNVLLSPEYTYSLQEKQYVTIRSKTTKHELEQEKEINGYFNLKDLSEPPPGDTEADAKTQDRDDKKTLPDNTFNGEFTKYERFGKFWYIEGNTGEKAIGIDDEGKPKKNAVLKECVITVVKDGSTQRLIGFHEQPYKDSTEKPYRPLIRGLCYIHPTKDSGAGDGKAAGELQVALNDTVNIGYYRTLLASMPMLQSFASEDNDTIYLAPNHVIEVQSVDQKVEPFIMPDNIAGTNAHIQLLSGKMQEATAIYPPTMGNTPARTSTTATASAVGESNSNKRSNYKSMTFENTFLADLYWMILQMTLQFARKETGKKLMGDKVYDFKPEFDFFYKPLSQSIQSDQSKQSKIQLWTQILGYVTQVQHPNIVNMFNYIMTEISKLMGDEFDNFASSLLNPEQPIEGSAGSIPGPQGGPSNEYGLDQSQAEMAARQAG